MTSTEDYYWPDDRQCWIPGQLVASSKDLDVVTISIGNHLDEYDAPQPGEAIKTINLKRLGMNHLCLQNSETFENILSLNCIHEASVLYNIKRLV